MLHPVPFAQRYSRTISFARQNPYTFPKQSAHATEQNESYKGLCGSSLGVFESKCATCLLDHCVPVNWQHIAAAALASTNLLQPSKVAASSSGSTSVVACDFQSAHPDIRNLLGRCNKATRAATATSIAASSARLRPAGRQRTSGGHPASATLISDRQPTQQRGDHRDKRGAA